MIHLLIIRLLRPLVLEIVRAEVEAAVKSATASFFDSANKGGYASRVIRGK